MTVREVPEVTPVPTSPVRVVTGTTHVDPLFDEIRIVTELFATVLSDKSYVNVSVFVAGACEV